MSLIASILLLALTRAEIIERMKAPPVTRVEGLVQVFAECPADMRREYQMPIAVFVGDICRKLAAGANLKLSRFAEPGIAVYLGDVRTNLATSVASRVRRRSDGSAYTRIYLPAPGFVDAGRLRLETVKAFHLAVKGETLDDDGARRALLEADPDLRRADEYDELERWLRGERTTLDDEGCLKLQRKVIAPGVALPEDVLRFASRLFLYPEVFSSPFPDGRRYCDFREAISLVKRDLRLRFIAYAYADDIVAYGAGRTAELNAAAEAYSAFLIELARGRLDEREMNRLLDEADGRLEAAMREARARSGEGGNGGKDEDKQDDHGQHG